VQFSRRSLLQAGAISMFAATTAPSARAATEETKRTRILRLAWAGIRIERDDVALFIDAIAPNPEDGRPGPALMPGAKGSFALVTHNHGDHCDLQALKIVLGDRGLLVAQEDAARLFDNRIVRVQQVREYEPVFLSRGGAEFVAFAVPASDGYGSPQVSWVIDDGERRFIHCGDTAWHGHFWDIARAYGPFDCAFLPINGFHGVQGRFDPVKEPMSLTPEQAVEAAQILGARTTVPIHFGSAGDPNYVEVKQPLDRFLAAARSAGIGTKVLAPGEEFAL
jgi:L-ascorbate metabolism protein UlaG (beta-lactamase superfamily)